MGRGQGVVDRLGQRAAAPVEAAQRAVLLAVVAAPGDLVREVLDDPEPLLERFERRDGVGQFQIGQRPVNEAVRLLLVLRFARVLGGYREWCLWVVCRDD